MSRDDYLTQRIRNAESDTENLISILVGKHWCPKQAAIDGFDKECMHLIPAEPHQKTAGASSVKVNALLKFIAPIEYNECL